MSTATAATTLVSLTTFKAWMKAVDSSLDTVLAQCADAASAELERSGWSFVTRSVSETLDGADKTDLWLRGRPIKSITSVVVSGVALATTAYAIDTRLGRLRRIDGQTWPSGVGNIVVTATVGFDAQDGAALPLDVVRACLDLAKAIYDEKSSGAVTLSSISLGPGSMVLKSGKVPPSVQRVLDTLRDTRV